MTDNTINNDMTMGGATGALLAGRYRVVRQLGQGGMGSVWLAEDEKLDGFKVAIKMLPSILVNNKRAYAQVKAEALVSLKLSHPNIATIRAFEEENGNPFLVMDYIAGRTLDDYLAEKGKLSEDETIRLLKPVAAALDYAHTQGVVHRDVKPGNVMIRKDGTPFVLDFGIAREIQETMTRVTGKLSSGTLLYMSPEQLNGDAPKPAQDIYSFAAMAYECLTGRPPFSRGQIEYQIEHDTPEALEPQFIKCGLGVMAGLAKSPEARPATCADVLSVEPVAKCQWGADDGASASRTRLVPGLVVLALAAFLGAGGWWYEHQRQTNTKKAISLFEAGNWDVAFQVAQKSDKSDPVLQFYFGAMYDLGRGVETNEIEAVKWYRKSAEQGNSDAQWMLGEMYLTGGEAGKNVMEAVRWLRKAAEQGNAKAQLRLGVCYGEGVGVSEDAAEAARWYHKAATQGDVKAQAMLGLCYQDGVGVMQDVTEAARWYQKAAEQGSAEAQVFLGSMYVIGSGVKKNEQEAVRLYRKAAEQGNAEAQYYLGVCYQSGVGVSKDEKKAAHWYRKAVEQGHQKAEESFERLNGK